MSTEKVPLWQQDIIEMPLAQAFPLLGTVQEFRNKKCIFNADHSKLFDVVSDRYQVTRHPVIMQAVIDALTSTFGDVTVNVETFNDGGHIKATFVIKGLAPIEVKVGDLVQLKLQLFNSYDRVWRFKVQLSADRLACTNGMTIGTSWGHFSTKHIGQMKDMQYIQTNCEALIKRAGELKDVWKEWQEIEVKREAAVALLTDKFPNKYAEQMLNIKFPTNQWDFYNQCTAVVTHNTSSAQRRIEFDEIVGKLFYKEL